MTKQVLLLVGALALPMQARAGACVYFAELEAGKGQTKCTYVEDEARCKSAAAAEASPAWLEAHSPKFVPNKSCNAAVEALNPQKPPKKKMATKGNQKTTKTDSPAAK